MEEKKKTVFLDTDKKVREQAGFRLPAMVPILFYNGQDRWTAARSLKEYQNSGELFGDYILNLKYYLVDLSELEEDYILSTNTVLDNIMYCDKYRKKLELAGAIRTACSRVGQLGLQETEEFRRWVKHILLSASLSVDFDKADFSVSPHYCRRTPLPHPHHPGAAT